MTSPEFDLDASPIPRSREENQERAFIAASRRKDRSLDARLESASRASMLHKKRTGKSLHITKDIVEKEAMYEEVDERYQEKRIRMLQAQNMQIEEQLNRQLLAALAVRANRGSSSSSSSSPSSAASARSSSASSASSAATHNHHHQHQHKRASSMTPRASVDGVRKLSLDLSSLRSSVSEGMHTGPLNSPVVMDQGGYAMSPSYEAVPQQNQQPEWSSSQVPSYVQQVPWSQQWTGFQPQQPPPPPQQQHIIQDIPQMPTHFPVRHRFASAPEISLHGLPANSLAMMPPTPAAAAAPTPAQQPQHSRIHSEPDASMIMQQLQHPISLAPSPKTQPTLETCSSPISTPQSPKSTGLEQVPVTVPQPDMEVLDKGNEGLLFSHDPDFDEFSRFALGLGNGAEMTERDTFGFDEFVALDDFTTAAA